jgi:hypothetical protein
LPSSGNPDRSSLSRAIRHLRVGGQIAHKCGGAMGIGMNNAPDALVMSR